MSDEDLHAKVGAARAPALDRYLASVAARNGSAWSATHNVLGPVLAIAGEDDAAFDRILAGIAAVMTKSDEARFEQQAVFACRGLSAASMLEVLSGAVQLAQPGWFVQLVVPPLAMLSEENFLRTWRALIELAIGIERDGQSAGYPVATGLAALITRGDVLQWIEILGPLAHAAKRSIYGLFEYGITGLAQRGLDDSDLADALRLAIAMFDHGLEPAGTLEALGTPVQLDIATTLAKAGVDPRLVITNGVDYFHELGQLDDGGERLERIAIGLHQRGLRQLLFEDGLDYLLFLEREHGLAERGLVLIESMISRSLEPAIIFRWSMPRIVGFMRPAWSAAELLGFAEQLVERNLEPEAAITWAARPLSEIATDVEDFRRLAGAVVSLVASLQAFGVDHREVLFHDVAALAQAGNESQTFRELLEAFRGLLAAWTGDPTELLKEALPAAAREAVGRPWVLAIALANATRMVREGRRAEAITLLTIGVKTAAQLGDQFEAVLLAVERRYAELPAALASHASIAAGVLAGTDLAKLDRVLELIAAANQRQPIGHGAMLPELARMAGEPEGFAALIEAMRTIAPRIATVAAQAVRNDAAAALRVLEGLDRWATTPERRATLERFTFGRVASPAGLVACIERAHEAMHGIPDRRVLTELLEHARTEATFVQMCTLVPPLLRDGRGPLVDGIQRAHELVARNPHAWTYLVAPALVTAKQHAGVLLSTASLIPNRFIEREADLEVIRDLITQRGVRAVDLIANLVVPALARKIMPSLAEHRELLERYLREVGFSDADVYAHFIEIVTAGGDAAKIASLRAEIAELTAGIRGGERADRSHPLFGVALQHVFPAAVSATGAMWKRLVESFPDRPGDVLALWPAGHDRPLEVAAGSWQLAGDHDLSVFGWLAKVLPDPSEPRDLTALGWDLLTAWSEGRLAREKVELTKALLAHVEALPSATFDSASQLLAIRALAADRLSGLVESAVVAARATDPARVDRLVQSRLAPAPRIGPGLLKSLTRTLDAVRSGTLARADAEKRLHGQLAMFELPEDPIAALEGDLAGALHALPVRRPVIEPGKELARIHADLVGQELAEMTAVIAKALEYRASSQLVTLDCTITKRALHAPIGLTAGVCVASDEELWNSPNFMHLALWLDGVCMGTTHLLVLAESDKRYLALPGINPSFGLLDRVEAKVLLAALLERVRALAHEAGLAGVWIPTSPGIHSNRRAIHEALNELELHGRATAGHAFSYSPYAYRIDRVWELATAI